MAAAPAYAASPCAEGCFELRWDQFEQGTRVDGETATTVNTAGVACGAPVTAAISVNMGGSPGTAAGSVQSSQCSTDRYSSTFNGVVDHRGEQNGNPAATRPYDLTRPGPPANPRPSNVDGLGLMLNIGHNTTTSVTFTLSQPVSSLAIKVNDITSNPTQTFPGLNYRDHVSFSQPTTVSGTPDGMYAPSATELAAGQEFYRTALINSSRGDVKNTFTTAPGIAPFSTFTVSYRAPDRCGWQFLQLGNLTVCL
ncbi:MAG: hypothetical protein Q4G34_00435 [Micrococcus sp.]|nr:hypothetical protein [Micrococcus sp.]